MASTSPPKHHRSPGPQSARWRAFTWTLSGILDHHNDNGALVMQLQPLEGEKPAGLRDLVRYRVCPGVWLRLHLRHRTTHQRRTWHGPRNRLEDHRSPPGPPMGNHSGRGHGPRRTGWWLGVGRSARSSRSAGQPAHAFRMAARGRATDAADHLKSWRACRHRVASRQDLPTIGPTRPHPLLLLAPWAARSTGGDVSQGRNTVSAVLGSRPPEPSAGSHTTCSTGDST